MSEQKAPRVQVNVMVPKETAGTVRRVAAALRDDPDLADRVLAVLGLDEPPPDRLAGLSGRVDVLEGGLPAVLARLDELAARLEQHIAATDARLARLEARRPEPATSADTAAVTKVASSQQPAPSDVQAADLLDRFRGAVTVVLAEGKPKAAIAKEVGLDPSALSKILLHGQKWFPANQAKARTWLASREVAAPAVAAGARFGDPG